MDAGRYARFATTTDADVLTRDRVREVESSGALVTKLGIDG